MLQNPLVPQNLTASTYSGFSQTARWICSKTKTHALVEHIRLMPQRCVLAEMFSDYFYSLHFKSLQLLHMHDIHRQRHDNVQWLLCYYYRAYLAYHLTRLVVTISSNHFDWVWLYRSTQRIRSSPAARKQIRYWVTAYENDVTMVCRDTKFIVYSTMVQF